MSISYWYTVNDVMPETLTQISSVVVERSGGVQFQAVTDFLVARAHGAEHGVKHETHGDQVTVERRPAEYIDGEYDGLDDVHDGPDDWLVVVFGRQAPRNDQPHDERAEAEPDERAEYGGQPGPAPAHQVRVAAAATGESVPGSLQRYAYSVGVSHQRIALEQTHEPVDDQHGHVGEHRDVVPGQVQPVHLHRLHAERQANDHLHDHPEQVPVQAALDRMLQLV